MAGDKEKEFFTRSMEAAKRGSSKGMYQAGFCYYSGVGVERNYEQALLWMREAAKQGYGNACRNLGDMYACGIGVSRDYGIAKKYYLKAKEYGCRRSEKEKEDHDLQVIEALIAFENTIEEKEQLDAKEAYKAACKYEAAEILLAFRYLKLAAKKGHAHAQAVVGSFYIEGDIVAKNVEEGLYWLEKSREQEEEYAYYYLGIMYMEGKDIPQDIQKAEAYLRKAKQLGSKEAKEELEKLVKKGYTVPSGQKIFHKVQGENEMENTLIQAVEQMKSGNEAGFNTVYSQTYNNVYFRARQLMKNEEDAQDLVQIVFVEAYRNIASLQAPEALHQWLYEITYRQGMKLFRKKKDVLLTEEAETVFDIIESEDVSTMPELTADQKATSEIIRGIIEELPELQRAAVVAYYFDNMKVEQIADVMECSAGTIKSRLNYARKYIKERVEEKERTEGYRLHVVTFPVLWAAIHQFAEELKLTAETAQTIYNGSCSNVGLPATVLHAFGNIVEVLEAGATAGGGVGAGVSAGTGAATAGTATAAGTSAAVSTGTATAVGTGATTAGTAAAGTSVAVSAGAATAGTGVGVGTAATVSVSLMTKAVIAVCTTVAVTTVGTVTYKEVKKHQEERPVVREETVVNTENEGGFMNNFMEGILEKVEGSDNGEDVTEEIITETENTEAEDAVEEQLEEAAPVAQSVTSLSTEAQHQLSSFVGALILWHSPNETDYNIFDDDAESCLWHVEHYIAYSDNYFPGGHDDDLVLGWDYVNETTWMRENVTRETFKLFYEKGWGITIPDNFNYMVGEGDPDNGAYGVKIREGGGFIDSTDGAMFAVHSGSVEITGYEDGVYTLQGSFSSGVTDVGTPVFEEHTFTATAVESGDDRVYDGLQITSLTVNP